MVNVQPKNSKLLDRSLRIIQAATGATSEQAAAALRSANNVVRDAIDRINDNRTRP
jgi:N-acetylmuramic acid 6-phosphate (MurNAc-6-P) etherase